MEKINLGKPISSEHTLNAVFKNHDGRNYICTTVSGSPAVLNIYDLDNDVVKSSFEFYPGSLNSWNHIINTDGKLYVMSYGRFYRYDFSTDELKSYGVLLHGENECFTMDNDEEGNLYLASCPGGKVIRFNIEDESIEDLGQVAPGVSYVRSISYLNGYLYCGVKGDSLLGFYKINAANPSEKYKIQVPEDKEYYPDGLQWIYTSKAVGDKIIIHCKANGICPLLIYDTINETFVDTGYKGNFPGLYVSPERDGKCYFINKGKLMEINVANGKVKESDFPECASNNSLSINFIRDTETGREFLAVLNNENTSVEYLDLIAGTRKMQKLKLEKAKYYIQTLELGDYINGDNGIYISGYCGNRAVRYDIDTGNITDLVLEQAEGMIGYKGKQYFGTYPGNILHVYDFKSDSNIPTRIGAMSEKQDRPFAICAGDGNIFMGTVPEYGLRGGDLIIYNVEGETIRVVKSPVAEQSIISLCYSDGLLYGSTSAWGGLSAIPDVNPAKVFIYDVYRDKMIKIFTPKIADINHPTWIGSIVKDKNNILWAVTGNTLFSLDAETEKVLNTVRFGDYTYSQSKHRWRPTYIRFDSKGNLYTNILGIKKVDLRTLEYEHITEEDEVFLFTIDKNDNIYYAVDSNFYKLENISVVSSSV